MGFGRGLQAVAALGSVLLILRWIARRSTAELPPVEPPAKRFWDEGRGTRLRFRVGRRKARQAAANVSHIERHLVRPAMTGENPQAFPNITAGRCHLDGTESEGGCSGHACLLGSCFCSRGSGGEWCERRPAERAACAAEEKQAYGALATGLKRHTAHDACAFYSGPYGTMAVDARRWEAAQVGGRHRRQAWVTGMGGRLRRLHVHACIMLMSHRIIRSGRPTLTLTLTLTL